MKIVACSDLHGKLPDLPKGDILLIAGDICPSYDHSLHFQAAWLDTSFRTWLKNQKFKHVIATLGNHDFIGQERPEFIKQMNLPCHFLVDAEITIENLRIWGTPWQPVFYDWAFNLTEPELKEKWDLIPQGIDVLICHGPPQGYGDLANDWESPIRPYPMIHVGSPSLTSKIEEVKPKLCVYGHIHSSYGQYVNPKCPDTILANVSYVNEKYEPVYAPMLFDL